MHRWIIKLSSPLLRCSSGEDHCLLLTHLCLRPEVIDLGGAALLQVRALYCYVGVLQRGYYVLYRCMSLCPNAVHTTHQHIPLSKPIHSPHPYHPFPIHVIHTLVSGLLVSCDGAAFAVYAVSAARFALSRSVPRRVPTCKVGGAAHSCASAPCWSTHAARRGRERDREEKCIVSDRQVAAKKGTYEGSVAWRDGIWWSKSDATLCCSEN